MPPRIQPETLDGHRKPSAETRAKLAAATKARFATMTPDERARVTAGLRAGRSPAPPSTPPPVTPPAPPAPVEKDWPGPFGATPLQLIRAGVRAARNRSRPPVTP